MDNSVQVDQASDLDLEAIFSGGAEKPIGDTEKVFECSNPHWSISREGLMKILRVVLSFPSRTSVFMAVWRVGNEIHFHANNRDAFVTAYLPLLNDNPYKTDKKYFLDSVKLYAFLNSYSQFALSFDPDSSMFYESPYVRYKLDSVKLNFDDVYIRGAVVEENKVIKFPISKNAIGVFKSLYGFSVKLSDSKILINSKTAEAFYTLYKFNVDSKAFSVVDDNVIIRRLDLSTLKEIVDDKTTFTFTKDRLFFVFEYGFVSFLRVPYDEESFMYPDTFLTGDSLCHFYLDVPLVKRALKLSSLFNVDSVFFSHVDTDVYMTISDRAKFKVGSIVSWKDLSPGFTVGLDIFSNLLSTVGSSNLSVSVSEHGVELTTDGDPSEVYSMARVSMSQLKQGKLPPVLETNISTGGGFSKPVVERTPLDFQDKEVF